MESHTIYKHTHKQLLHVDYIIKHKVTLGITAGCISFATQSIAEAIVIVPLEIFLFSPNDFPVIDVIKNICVELSSFPHVSIQMMINYLYTD